MTRIIGRRPQTQKGAVILTVALMMFSLLGFTYGGMLRFDDIVSQTYGDHVQRTASLHG